MATALVREGAQVLFTATDRMALQEAVEQSGGTADQTAIHVANLAKPNEVDSVIDAAHRAFGGVDVLVNNAGVSVGSLRSDFWQNPLRYWDVSDADFRMFFEINLFQAARLIALVTPEMRARQWGRIVNVTTSLSTMLASGIGPYGCSKAALEALTSTMAGDLAGSGVTANVLAPGGPADTRMIPDGAGVAREALIPADCMAAPMVWLASNASDGVTGKRFLGVKWDAKLPPDEAAAKAGAAVAWTGFGDQAKMPDRGSQRAE